MDNLFGTDGVRGKANIYPITPEVALQLGKTIAHVFHASGHGSCRAVIGKDTRLSGYMLESALTSGMVSMGMDVYLVGPMPTPAVAHLTRTMVADAGIMITASHNRAADNGLKIFGGDGYKLSSMLEDEIQTLVGGSEISSRHIGYDQIGKAHRIEDARGRYIEFVKSTVGSSSLSGMKVVIDCANGASYFLGPLIFKELGATVVKVGTEPDGYNINSGCGALDTASLCQTVIETGADIGIALDGDGDRSVFCDAEGNIVHGDCTLGLMAVGLKEQGRLKKDTVVVTVMSNNGFHQTMKRHGIQVLTTPVGDRHIIDELRRTGCSFGGESSGHIVMPDYGTTSDGIVSALQLMQMMKSQGKSLKELTSFIDLFPEKMVSLEVKEKIPLESLSGIRGVTEECTRALDGHGRCLVRYSGTENVIRILVEAEAEADAAQWLGRVVDMVNSELDVV